MTSSLRSVTTSSSSSEVLKSEFAVELVAADSSEVVAFRIEEKAHDRRAGIGKRRRFARTNLAIEIFQGRLVGIGRIFCEHLDDRAGLVGIFCDSDSV